NRQRRGSYHRSRWSYVARAIEAADDTAVERIDDTAGLQAVGDPDAVLVGHREGELVTAAAGGDACAVKKAEQGPRTGLLGLEPAAVEKLHRDRCHAGVGLVRPGHVDAAWRFMPVDDIGTVER